MAKKASPRKSTAGGAKKAVKSAPAGGAKGKGSKKSAKSTKAAAKPAGKSAKAAKKTVKKKTAAKAAKKVVKKVAKAARKKKSKALKSPLTSQELKEFRKLLLAKRRELVGDMTGIEAEALGADRQESKGDISDHPADAGTDNFEQEFSLGLLESERNMLAEIDQALTRIERGHYGICLGTGKPIGKARLTARPWAPYGIEYARMVEKGLVRAGERVEAEFDDDDEFDDDIDDADQDDDGGDGPDHDDDQADYDD